ncbi:hypothetical protein MBLNU459_g1260t2 [Dothideomycetes sp. NU459]
MALYGELQVDAEKWGPAKESHFPMFEILFPIRMFPTCHETPRDKEALMTYGNWAYPGVREPEDICKVSMDVEGASKSLKDGAHCDAMIEMARERAKEIDYDPTTATEPPERPKYPGSINRPAPWCSHDSVLQTWSFPELVHKGFVTSSDPAEMEMDEPFQPLEDAMLEACMQHHGTPDVLDSEDINPVFQFNRWRDLHHEDYNVLRPVLKLASCILEEPSLMTFFNGLIGQKWKDLLMTESRKVKFAGRQLQYFEPSETFDPAVSALGYHSLWQVIANMRHFVTWRFGNLDNSPAYGITKAIVGERGMSGTFDTAPSEIILNERYIGPLMGLTSASDVTPNIAPTGAQIDRPALLRARLSLADTMVHEFCHALCAATQPGLAFGVPEPFFRDMRKAEVGFAFSVTTFGGVPRGIGQDADCPEKFWEFPFGASLDEWPNLHSADNDELGSSYKFDRLVHERVAISMKHIHNFFTDRFWDEDVDRYQHWAYHLPEEQKTHAVTTDGPSWFLVGESPVKRNFLPPLETREQAVKRLDEWRQALRQQQEAREKPPFDWLDAVLEENERMFGGLGTEMDES